MYDELAEFYDDVVDGVDYAAWARRMHDTWSAHDAGVRRVLDVCCGTGRMSAELVALGYDVVGFDGSAAMVERARELLGPAVPVSVGVLPDVPEVGVFDAAVSNFDSLNYLPLAQCRDAIAAVAAHLRADGWFVFDVHTEVLMRAIAAQRVTEGVTGDKPFRLVNDVDVDARTCATHLELTTPTGTVVEDHWQFFFSEDELRAALGDAGLAVVTVLDDYTAAPAGPDTLRATWVARRQA